MLTDDVADLAVALMLASLRQVVAADRWVRDGAWVARGALPLTTAVAKRRVGIVGLGRIGQAIAQRCAAFGTEIAYYGPNRKPVDWAYYADPVLRPMPQASGSGAPGAHAGAASVAGASAGGCT